MKDLRVEDLLDDINTDAMTPAWVCFDYDPHIIAKNAYAGLIVSGERLFPRGYDAITQLVIKQGGLFPFAKAVERGEVEIPVPNTPRRPMTMGEKILARHARGTDYVKPGDAIVADVDGGYTHEFTTAQVH